MLSWRSGYASASQDAAKQVRATPLNGSNDVRNRWYQYWNVSRIISQLAVEIHPRMRARAVCSYPKSEAPLLCFLWMRIPKGSVMCDVAFCDAIMLRELPAVQSRV